MSDCNDYCPFDDMNEEEYYYQEQQRLNEEWALYEYMQSQENEEKFESEVNNRGGAEEMT